MKVGIVDYGSGNIASVRNALEYYKYIGLPHHLLQTIDTLKDLQRAELMYKVFHHG